MEPKMSAPRPLWLFQYECVVCHKRFQRFYEVPRRTGVRCVYCLGRSELLDEAEPRLPPASVVAEPESVRPAASLPQATGVARRTSSILALLGGVVLALAAAPLIKALGGEGHVTGGIFVGLGTLALLAVLASAGAGTRLGSRRNKKG